MNILVINCGSSSLKYQLINMNEEKVYAKGLCERIGIDGSRLKHTPSGKDTIIIEAPMPNHKEAVKMVLDALTHEEYGVVKSMDEISAVGHRVVHGGESFSESVIIDEEVKKAIEACSELAPLHNPPNLIGIEACQHLMPNTPMVAVFDTAFHQTMPNYAYLYAIPYELYEKHKIRRYGFHGTSHKYVAYRAAELLGKPIEELKIVTCHLGNGASVCAVKNGKSVDTSMGFTPLAGLVMGTRCGDIDPAIVTYLQDKENLSAQEVDNLLNKKSGVLGLSGISSDFRDIEDAVKEGNEKAAVTMDVFNYIVAKYVGAYAAAMNGLDAIVFTAGLGENNHEVRRDVCKYLEFLGVKIDEEKNQCRGVERDFSAEGAKIRTLVIPTNEELMIARETKNLLKK
ncbi:MAG: acetate kinase [Epulopiscium sp.]|jgi:acetate kinase|uniref:Acetate kinase n=1 Tax=Defluviitalea raffinosedens TaxID=1450156 RepID=A0A7C8LUU0_9FIRM|nr:acetate kinase [Defluviitalea raffinosedens]MBZ4668518.1 ackA [Defluviitaleaceae bacterium]MDK2789380.1 acetate kinase [Candidatus Epulonipiscium sp.]KAE9637186.1 acetate/propionate family kinase [Defluviitalea raffinosedens]MBM7686510.1 acetate kinase [Defluviitalea raffinosedens]HHW66787.1 acetate kinase [Candidatus Epulonipiscium sp.]